MKYYQQLQLLPDAETSVYVLWEKVYQQVHLAIAEAQQGNVNKIGITFPEYDAEKFQLGNKLRLFASTEEALNQLNLTKWLTRLSDYVHITRVRLVPDTITEYAIFKRVQLKNNNKRLARRKAKREKIAYQEALDYFSGRAENFSCLPYIHLKSFSSQQKYRLFIACEKAEPTNQLAVFNSYGLSSSHALPLF
jgi:CRISPR-associated endonuclease Csy4